MSTLSASILKYQLGQVLAAEDVLAVEEPLGIAVIYGPERRRKNLAVTMRTPGQDEELALGFLFTEGIIRRADEVLDIRRDDDNRVTVLLHQEVLLDIQSLERNFYTTSSCGVCGKASIEAVQLSLGTRTSTSSAWQVPATLLHQLPGTLRRQQRLFEQTGGLHAAALFSQEGALLAVREDVGRHNALDKLIGTALQSGKVPLRHYLLLLSGRASFELIQKAGMAGLGFVAAVGAPSSLAVQLANEMDITLVLVLSVSGCAFRRAVSTRNIPYAQADTARGIKEKQLSVFAPRKRNNSRNVLLFIHGGNWNSGTKDLYSFLGNRMARKGVVLVVIDYPLSPEANYDQMAAYSARAVHWVQQNISRYGGNPDRIFVSGHSAGGHLASLISLRNEYFDSLRTRNPIKGTILIDAAGLDMYGYLREKGYGEGHTYMKTFTADPQEWKKASPILHLHENMPPMLIYRGGKTYPSIEKSTEKFIPALKNYVPSPRYKVQPGKRHIGMITQFFFTWNPRYREILRFMEE